MSDKTKNKIVVFLISFVILAFSIACIVQPDQALSMSEKRPLQQFPQIKKDSLLSGTFMHQFEDYAVDQFVFRDQFRSLHANILQHIFQQQDIDGLYIDDQGAFKMEYPLQESSLDHAAAVFEKIYERYLKDQNVNIYLSIIPDKSYFMKEQMDILSMDYEAFLEMILNKTTYMTYIDIFPLLEREDYYQTDPHWRQEKIVDVAQLLAEKMGNTYTTSFSQHPLEMPMCGTYCSQSAIALNEETMYYLTNDIMEQCIVYDHENNREISMYDMAKANRDPYDLFLSGSISYVTIENSNATSSKELVVFRDSFASALMPLLCEQYAKISLIDIRYLSSRMLENLIEFNDQDVLFLYSASVLNHSETLK